MEYDKDKVDEMILALLYLTSSRDQYAIRAWKGLDVNILDRLHAKGYVGDPRGKGPTIDLTDAGAALSKELFIKILAFKDNMEEIDISHLRSAIALAWQARQHGNHPFGAVLVDEHNRVVLEAENTVDTGRDVTGHAETNLVRLAAGQFSPEELRRFSLYTSTEPCGMCAGAIHWSQIGRVVYALSETDLYDMVGPSPEHLLLPCRKSLPTASARSRYSARRLNWKRKPGRCMKDSGSYHNQEEQT